MASSNTDPAPVSADTSPAPTRIKRNTACVKCRDAKVKCNASLNPNHPCLRCAKLDLECVIDKGHKRTSRRSKLEELAAEVRNIREAVVASSPSVGAVSSLPPPLRPDQFPGPHIRQQPYTNHRIAPTYVTSTSIPPSFAGSVAVEPPALTARGGLSNLAAPSSRPSGQTAEPRALASRVFSGEDIDYYFDKYFEHFHPFLPIVRSRDPDLCYRSAPLLFWAIIATACRRYARGERTFKFLVDSMSPEIWGAVAIAPLRSPVVNALLILSTWPLPDLRFMTDPTYVLTGIALNSGLYLGLPTGKGALPELGAKNQLGSTDEEAVYTWCACNIVSQRVSSYMGFPSVAPFSGKPVDLVLCGHNSFNMPRSFTIALQAAKFTNRLSKTVAAALHETTGISHHLLDVAEEEFFTLQHSLHTGIPDVDDFTLRSALMDVHMLYWLSGPGSSDEVFRGNTIKCFNTAQGLVRLALQLERNAGFLSHSPHFAFRSLLAAGCCIMAHLRSPHAPTNPDEIKAGDIIIRDTVAALKACSVAEGDLCMRVPYIMESYWSMKEHAGDCDTSQLGWSFVHRLGASIVYDCLGKWKREVERARESVGLAAARPGHTEANHGAAPAGSNTANADLGLTDPFLQKIDWGSFMDDFEWNPASVYTSRA